LQRQALPRPPRAGEAGGLYPALNRGNLRATIFHKDADFEAFERIYFGHVYCPAVSSLDVQRIDSVAQFIAIGSGVIVHVPTSSTNELVDLFLKPGKFRLRSKFF
jgi:hypothetical protein